MATHFKGPVLNREQQENHDRAQYSKMPMGESPEYIVYKNDFIAEQDYAASDWTITTTEDGAGSATEALASDERGGALLITNDDADNDSDALEHTQEVFKLESGKRLWYSTRVKVNDADQVDMFMGLAINSTDPLTAGDRVGFQIDDGDASILVKTEKDGTETSSDSDKDASDDTYVKLELYFDGAGQVKYYIDDKHVATHSSNVPDDENIAVAMQLVNGEAAAQNMTVDYIYVVQER